MKELKNRPQINFPDEDETDNCPVITYLWETNFKVFELYAIARCYQTTDGTLDPVILITLLKRYKKGKLRYKLLQFAYLHSAYMELKHELRS